MSALQHREMASPISDTVIAHVDMDAFYASVEQRDQPGLRGRPVAVGRSDRRAVVLAASYEARAFGVRSAIPLERARDLCPELVLVAPRMRVYAEIAAAVREILYRYTPLVEPLSLDEAFLDISGVLRLFGEPREIAEKIRSDIRRELELPASIGIGPGKLVAKIAGRHAKPDGVLVVRADDVRSFLAPLAVREMWGVGPKTEAKLQALRIATIGQLARADPGLLERELGHWGVALRALARGEDLRTVEADRGRKSYSEENTFPYDEGDLEVIEAMLVAHAETLARRLRSDRVRARTVTLKYKPSSHSARRRALSRSVTLAEPVDDGATIGRIAVGLWRRLPPTELRLVGVRVTNLDGERPIQLGLFSAATDEKMRALNGALDTLAERFGSNAVRRGA